MIITQVMDINFGECTTVSFPSFSQTGLVRHAFSTRLGGVSEGIFSTLNLSFTIGDEYKKVYENYRRFCADASIICDNLVLARQTHKTNVRVVTEEDCGKGIIKERDYDHIDAIITDRPGVPLCTLYADCVPIFLLDTQRKAIGMAHAGWRGTAGEIARITVEKMTEVFGCKPENILAGIAPSIGKCCFEVDDPVMDEMKKITDICLRDAYTEKGSGKYMLDLKQVNRMVLLKAGIPDANITVSDICTCCQSDSFHSHRATSGQRGSLAGIIQLI